MKKEIPYWKLHNIKPFVVNEERLNQEVIMKERFKPIPVDEDELDAKIKDASTMQDPKDSMWFDEMDNTDPNKIVDNNDFDDLDKKQKLEIKVPANQSIVAMIKNKLRKEKQAPEKARIAKPGEFVIMYKDKVCNIGSLNDIKESCINIIESNENISDDDILVFLRIPLQKIFK